MNPVLTKSVHKVVNNWLPIWKMLEHVLPYQELRYLECMCTGLLWSNIQKLSTRTFAFQIIYHLTSLLGTHFGVDGTCDNLPFMEMINLILTYTQKYY